MSFLARLQRSNFVIKLKSWEYWPFGILQAPLFFYWLWLSLKARSLVFFSASNPGILMGGMFGESKFDVLEKVPSSVKPKTFLVKLPARCQDIERQMQAMGMAYPVIVKPDLGERGWLVRRMNGSDDLVEYLKEVPIQFLVQELVDLPLEFGVFYIRYPWEPNGRVTSVVGKEMLTVTGDGNKTLRELILEKDRAKLQWEVLQVTYHDRLEQVLPNGEKFELVSIGNHCLGTKFLNANHLITQEMCDSFNRISLAIDGFYFGRYDLRAASVEDLQRGVVMVMELNGCGAEPAHIYQPGSSLLEAVRVLFQHWKDIYDISVANHKRGVKYLSLREARAIYRNFKMRSEP